LSTDASAAFVGDRVVDLVLDARRGERISIELPLTLRTPLAASARALQLADWADLSDPIVAKGVAVVDAAARSDSPVHLAILGGVAHRLRSPSSNAGSSGLRRSLHDLDIACLHREIRSVRAFLETVHEREGSGLRFFATDGDRIFNSLGEGRRFRYHMVTALRGSDVDLGTVDLLADEFRFCHRMDLRDEVPLSRAQHGTLSLATLLLAKLQFIQRIPSDDAAKVPGRVLEPFGRRDIAIGPEAKDVQDILALLADHPIADGAEGISPTRIAAVLEPDGGFYRTVELNLGMLERSPVLSAVPEPLGRTIRARLADLRAVLGKIVPRRRRSLFGGPWWEEVDSQPSVDGTSSVG
jgi:hypothetical protein